jgi:hypothetical protein
MVLGASQSERNAERHLWPQALIGQRMVMRASRVCLDHALDQDKKP